MHKKRPNFSHPDRSDPYIWMLEMLFHLSLAEIARRTGISRATINRLRQGKKPSSITLYKLEALVFEMRDEMDKEARAAVVGHSQHHQIHHPIFVKFRKARYNLINELLLHPYGANPQDVLKRSPFPERALHKEASKRHVPMPIVRRYAHRQGWERILKEETIYWLRPSDPILHLAKECAAGPIHVKESTLDPHLLRPSIKRFRFKVTKDRMISLPRFTKLLGPVPIGWNE